MGRARQGSIVRGGNTIHARVTFVDERGRRQEKWRRADNRTHAKELIKLILRELDSRGESALNGNRMTVRELADYFQTNYVVPAHYVGGRKVSGLRSVEPVLAYLRTVREYFWEISLT